MRNLRRAPRSLDRLCLVLVSALTGLLVATSGQAQETFVDLGFEVDQGYPIGPGVVGPRTVMGGTFSIPLNPNDRFLTDSDEARVGNQSVRLAQQYTQANEFRIDVPTQAAIDASTEAIDVTYSVYRAEATTGGVPRFLGWGGPVGTEEMWQLDILEGGTIRYNHRTDDGGTGTGSMDTANPGNLTGWYDFVISLDFNKQKFERVQSVTYRAPGESIFTELLASGPKGFASPFACCTANGNVGTQTIGTLDFRGENFSGTISSETRWDDVKIIESGATEPPDDTFDRTWNVNQSGLWTDGGNWTGGLGGAPASANAIRDAILGPMITSSRVAFTETDVTVNSVRFDNPVSYFVSGAGSINVVAGTNSTLAAPGFAVDQGSHEFQAVVNIHNSATANVADGSTLTFNNSLNLNGQTLTKTGSGTLNVRNDLTFGGGMLSLQQGTIAGNGSIGGDVANDGGTISPGNSLEATESNQVPEPNAWLLVVAAWLIMLCWRKQKT